VNVTPEGVMEVMKLFLDTSVCSLDEEHGDEEKPNLSAIKSLQYESFSLPIEDRIVLEQALESLTKLQSKVVYLFFYKDLSQTEIGKRLGLPQRKISDIIASSIKALRNHQETESRGPEQSK
jgi:RNA polymerase sigma-B factor